MWVIGVQSKVSASQTVVFKFRQLSRITYTMYLLLVMEFTNMSLPLV